MPSKIMSVTELEAGLGGGMEHNPSPPGANTHRAQMSPVNMAIHMQQQRNLHAALQVCSKTLGFVYNVFILKVTILKMMIVLIQCLDYSAFLHNDD